jgi:hypothetical protein
MQPSGHRTVSSLVACRGIYGYAGDGMNGIRRASSGAAIIGQQRPSSPGGHHQLEVDLANLLKD